MCVQCYETILLFGHNKGKRSGKGGIKMGLSLAEERKGAFAQTMLSAADTAVFLCCLHLHLHYLALGKVPLTKCLVTAWCALIET